MKRFISILICAVLTVAVIATLATEAKSQETVGEYLQMHEWSKAALHSPVLPRMVDTSKYKKKPPYVIAHANVAVTNSWGVFSAAEFKARAEKYKAKGLISKYYLTDAQNKPEKQISDIQDLVAKGVDVLTLRACTEAAIDPIVTRLHKQGIPIICVSRAVKSDNYTSFLTASLFTMGRTQAVWMAQYLKGKGNIVIIGGVPGAGPAVDRIAAQKEALSHYPGIKVLDVQYGYWQAGKGKQVMAALIQSYGGKIDGVLMDSGLQGSGALEALHEAGIKVPVTGDFCNGFFKRVQKWGYDACAVSFPPSLAGDAVDVAIQIMQGIPVPFNNIRQNCVSTTVDTKDVKADLPWAKVCRMDKSDDFWCHNSLKEEEMPY